MSDCVEISGMFNIKRISDNNKTPSWIGIIESYIFKGWHWNFNYLNMFKKLRITLYAHPDGQN